MRINSKTLTAVLLGVLVTLPGYADPVDRSIVMLGASYGYYDFDDERELDNRDFGGVSLGLHFTKAFSMALFYSRTYVEQEGVDKRRYENYFVEGSWYFNTDSAFRPYIVGGLGETLQGEGKLADDTTAQLGVGLNWVIDPHWSLRGDWRYLHVLDESTEDQMFMTTVVYRFGGGEGAL